MRLGFHLAAAFLAVALCSASDWPQFLGPHRNGATSQQIAAAWPKEGPPLLWKKQVGRGFAGPVAAGGRVYLFHRKEEQEVVTCFRAQDGQALWEKAYPATYKDDFGFDDGPRATPSLSGNTLITYGPDGMITAWSASDGARKWQVDARKMFDSPKGFFGRAPSPLIDSGMVFIHSGGKGAAIAALRIEDGSVAWKSGDDEASYASPVLATLGGKEVLLSLMRERLLLLDPGSGRITHQFPFKPGINASVSAATPIVSGDTLFLTASYGAGAVALQLRSGELKVLWRADDRLSSHYSTPVAHRGLIFGFDGRQEEGPEFVCVELTAGKERWRTRLPGAGSVLLANDQLLVLTERGELIVVPASGEQFKPIARAQVLGFETRAHPALADGLLFARDKQNLVCLDLRPHRE